MQAHPQIRIEAQFADRYVDIVAERVDMAIRLGSLKASGLTTRRLAPFSRVLCAAPSYLARWGTPATPADLIDHACLGFLQRNRSFFHLRRNDEEVEVPVTGLLLADDGEVLLTGALGGAGILLASDWLVGRELADGRLTEVLPDWSASDSDAISIILPPGRLIPAKTRAFIDWISPSFSPIPPWRP